MVANRVALAGAFAGAARRYWLSVFPRVSAELRHWRRRALAIPDPKLRALALEAQVKRGNMEGAAAFAAFVPHRHRLEAARAAVAFQSAYNYLDILVEQPSPDPVSNGQRLHSALLAALDPQRPPCDYYEFHERSEDGGYLEEMIERCRAATAQLPSYEVVAPAARRTAERIVSFQSFNTGQAQGDYAALEAWARSLVPESDGLHWWETAASGGSSLVAYVTIAMAAEPHLSPERVAAVERAYFPWIGALHSLLDNLVDADEDRWTGQQSLVAYYDSWPEMAERMEWLARKSLRCARELPNGQHHEMIVTAMCCFYLSAPEARTREVMPVSSQVLATMGGLAKPTMAVFAARHTASRARRAARRWLRRSSQQRTPAAPPARSSEEPAQLPLAKRSGEA